MDEGIIGPSSSRGQARARRPRLSRDRVVEGAIELADGIGASSLTIRKLATHLGVKPMAIYNYVASKEEILDAMVDAVFGEFTSPPEDRPWREAIGIRCHSARAVLARHPWATPLLDSRTSPGPETVRHHNAVLGCFRRAGFSLPLTAHAYALIDSHLFGFALQEAALPALGGDEMVALAGELMAAFDGLPHLRELTVDHVLQPGYDFRDEFAFGLDLILDGLERSRDAERAHPEGGMGP
ncbi:MAG: TetR/AcrR family transcriptional regulator [Acidimicrobiales bacterium]